MSVKSSQRKLNKLFGGRVSCREEDGCIFVTGELDSWDDVIKACSVCAKQYSKVHVVNDIKFTGAEVTPMRTPDISDSSLEGDCPDVLVIGGGITGCTMLRELMRYKVDALLVDKECDLAMHASSRNDGQVHPGVDLGNGNLKHEYVLKGNHIYDDICSELGIEFKRVGQYGSITDKGAPVILWLYGMVRKYINHVSDTKTISARKLYELEPNFNPGFKAGLWNPSSGVVSPYELTIAYAENAVQNGARVSLNTAVTGMEVEDGEIKAVQTNRGTLYPKVVVNCAGVFAEDIAAMARDRFFSIHPRKGTNSITDKKTGSLVKGITSVKSIFTYSGSTHTKGGGILHTVHDNLLVGPDAIETYEKENFATEKSSIDAVFQKQQKAVSKLQKKDILTYFTGVRAPTFEEDFILERGRRTKNIVHLAGIQSPGLTAAPAFSKDMSVLTVDVLKQYRDVEKNEKFNPVRKPIPVLRNMTDKERNALIKANPDYGVIVCRCEEISKGEILDALKSPLCPPTVDGVKKRVRPGMGRCQGGFCMPQVIKIISEYTGLPECEVKKSSDRAFISYGFAPKGAGK